MKKSFFALLLIMGIAFGMYGQSAGTTVISGPMDLVLLLDTSASMSSSYRETSDYLIGPFMREFLRIGDTFHLISFAETPKVEISRRIQQTGDVEAIIGRILLLYPLDPKTEMETAVSFAEEYAASLPGSRPRKVVLVTDDDNPNTQTLVNQSSARLRNQNADLQYIRTPVTGTPPVSGRTSQTAAASPPPALPPASTSPVTQPSPSSTSPAASTSTPSTTPSSPPPAVSITTPSAAPATPSSTQAPATTSTTTQPAPAPSTAAQTAPTSTVPPAQTTTQSAVPPASTQSQTGQSAQTTPPPVTTAPPQSTAQGTVPSASSATAPAAASASQATTPSAATPSAAAPSASTQSTPSQSAQPAQTTPSTTATQSAATQPPAAQREQAAGRQSQNRTSQDASDGIPLPLLIVLGILALILLGLLVFFAVRHLQNSPNRAMAQATHRDTSHSERVRANAERQANIKNAELMGTYAAARQVETAQPLEHPPKPLKPMPKDMVYEEPLESDGPLMLNLFVEDQNTAIGRRNIHAVKSGYTFSVGGGKSDFLIFLVPVPPRIADVYFDGRNCTFTPRKPQYFPDIGAQPVSNCIGKNIRVISDKNYELHVRIERYQDPLKALNRMLNSILIPGETGKAKTGS